MLRRLIFNHKSRKVVEDDLGDLWFLSQGNYFLKKANNTKLDFGFIRENHRVDETSENFENIIYFPRKKFVYSSQLFESVEILNPIFAAQKLFYLGNHFLLVFSWIQRHEMLERSDLYFELLVHFSMFYFSLIVKW